MEIFRETRTVLSEVLNLPDGYEIFFTSSATEIWERIIQNLIVKSSHHFVNGSFSKRFFDFTNDYGLKSTQTLTEGGNEFKNWEVPEAAELISVTMNETSIGYTFDNVKLRELRERFPEKIISLDIVSISPAVKIDFSLVDTAYFSVQKCFGLPAGLGVWIVNNKVQEIANNKKSKNALTGSYHSISSLKKYADKDQTPETPNVLNIYLLARVANDMLQRGISMIQNETIYKSTLLYQLFEDHPALNPYIIDAKNRSKTVCVANVNGGNDKLLHHLSSKGMILGKGYGSFKNEHIRIANFPTHSKEQVELLVDTISNF